MPLFVKAHRLLRNILLSRRGVAGVVFGGEFGVQNDVSKRRVCFPIAICHRRDFGVGSVGQVTAADKTRSVKRRGRRRLVGWRRR
jgi:hypothetical protein